MENEVNRLEATMLALIGAILSLNACASAGKHGEDCGLRSTDSTFAMRAPVYRDCAVDKKVNLLTTSVHPDYRPPSTRNGCYTAELEFVVDTLGHPVTETAHVVRTNEQGLGEALMTIVPQLKYQAATKNGVHVRQIVSFKQTVQTMSVIVPKGSAPPTTPPTTHAPNC
jgi:hypothetical protein